MERELRMCGVEFDFAECKLRDDIRQAAHRLGVRQGRYLVDAYYLFQEQRKRLNNQILALSDAGEPATVLTYFADQMERLERGIRKVLDYWTSNSVVGRWAKGQYGIGPVITAGLMAHIDMEVAKTPAKVWRYAGLDPTVKWEKGHRRPWNASLKRLCFLIGDSFCKFHKRPECFYGKLYEKRKEYEVAKNEKGDYAEQARVLLETKRYDRSTETYKHLSNGKLSPAHIDMRARRWAVKIFLAHYWAVAYRDHYKVDPPKPYAIAHLGHVDEIPVPGWPF